MKKDGNIRKIEVCLVWNHCDSFFARYDYFSTSNPSFFFMRSVIPKKNRQYRVFFGHIQIRTLLKKRRSIAYWIFKGKDDAAKTDDFEHKI